MSNESESDRPEPLPIREPGATLRDNPIPPPRIHLDHHANHCFGQPRRDTTDGPHANNAF